MQRISDLRFVIGLFLSLIGLILILAHLSAGGEAVEGIHLNLVSGLLFLVVGGAMLCLSIFSPAADEPQGQLN